MGRRKKERDPLSIKIKFTSPSGTNRVMKIGDPHTGNPLTEDPLTTYQVKSPVKRVKSDEEIMNVKKRCTSFEGVVEVIDGCGESPSVSIRHMKSKSKMKTKSKTV